MKAGLEYLKATGSMPDKAKEMTPQQLFRICGLDASIQVDKESGGENFKSGVD